MLTESVMDQMARNVAQNSNCQGDQTKAMTWAL